MRLVAARDITVADLPYISNPFFAKNDVRDAYCDGFTSIHNLNEFVPAQWRNYQQGLDELLKKIDKMEVCLVYSMKLPFLGVVYWQQDPDYPNNPQKGRWVASLSGINQYENLQGIVSSAYSKIMAPQTHSQQRSLSRNVVKTVDNQGLKATEKQEIKQAKPDKKSGEETNKQVKAAAANWYSRYQADSIMIPADISSLERGEQQALIRRYIANNTSPLKQTGGGGYTASADDLYDAIRASDSDVSAIASSTGFKPGNIQKVKDHVFYNEHLLDRYVDQGIPATVGRFDSTIEQAQAWKRLESGTHTDADITWMKHEIAERWYELKYDSGYSKAHDRVDWRWRGFPWGVE